MTTVEYAQAYRAKGWQPVPLLPKEKRPNAEGWTTFNFQDAAFAGNGNIGVKLGTPSGGLVDVDIDMAEALPLADTMLPPSVLVFGRKSKPRSHRLFSCPDCGKTRRWKHADGRTILELRSTGGQTMAPGSVHPSGEAVEWENGSLSAALPVVGWATLEAACQQIADTISPPPPKVPAPVPPPPAPAQPGKGAAPRRRCLAYLDKCPDAISGQDGHGKTYRAACECYRFGLSDGEARQVMEAFNQCKTGDEAWNSREIEHKLDDAKKAVLAAGEFGMRLAQGKAPSTPINVSGVGPISEPPKTPPQVPAVEPATPGLPTTPPKKPRRATPLRPPSLTDLGNAERFIAMCGEDLRYCPELGKWIEWTGKRWEWREPFALVPRAKQVAHAMLDEAKAESDDDRRKAVLKWAITTHGRGRLEAMIDLSRAWLMIRTDQLDADRWLFNVENGTIDLESGCLRPPERFDFITRKAPVEYDATAPCPRWDQFLKEITPQDGVLSEFLCRLLGMCLSGDIGEQKLFIFWGCGANGKGVLLDTVMGLMGPYAANAAPNMLMQKNHEDHPTEIADLYRKRLVVASESDEGGRLRAQLVKRLTGDARLKARLMRQDFFEFDRTHKLILVTNNKPIIRENTVAIARRVRLVPFGVTIPDDAQDHGLLTRLESEWPGVLNWLIRGCLLWRERGLETPNLVSSATAGFLADQDVLAEFLAACCLIGESLSVVRGELYSCYCRWCNANDEKYPLGKIGFFEKIRAMPGISESEDQYQQ